MSKRWCFVLVAALLFASPVSRAAVDLTPTERAWLEAALPVLAFARTESLPLDIVVQPQANPGETPLGMAFVAGRCKLVFSMRGNPEAQATLDRVAPSLRGPVVEAIAAHELGHCWRHLQGHWGTLPDKLEVIDGLSQVAADVAAQLRDMWRTRREEGYADLVGLAWTLRHHPDRYAEVYAWNARLRAEQELDTGPHDTRVWVRLAANPAGFTPTLSLFEQVNALWVAGLLAGT